ncbi:helix-turn-helix transcriptional regulator [Amycolatopsis anabasis]|uniref:helix-turn-helix transcriptional regulator n=1 Tax=Amycolatopsis anabasis TaxID=1840409 RepID=UPI00131C69E3|nr:helix-turn-helix transcriptional regulator [Amycolatopsis anabasis]
MRSAAVVYRGLPDRLLLLAYDPWLGPQLVRIAQRAAAPSEAAAAVAGTRRLAESNPGVAGAVAAARHAEALIRGSRAELRAAADAYRSASHPLGLASALSDAAAAERAGGNRAEAVRLYQEAFQLWSAAGAVRDIARVQRALRELGVRRKLPRTGQATGWDSITAGELRVVRLVAEGLTNRQVASRLFLSHHTVDAHLRRAFTKLGVRSRLELARRAAPHLAANLGGGR